MNRGQGAGARGQGTGRNGLGGAIRCALVAGLTVACAGMLDWGAGQPVCSAPLAAPEKEKPEPADNSYCYVCHANYEGEKLVNVHQPAGVGCEKCHGQSVKHSGDEDGLTPPERMFPKAEIDAFCMTCHEKGKLLKRDDHREFFQDPDPGETCSNCHAEKHRLQVRTRIWDKKTGKLMKDDGVRMMLKDSPATQGAGRKSK